jgi:hypothetical protein
VRLDARSIDLIRQVVCTEAGPDTRVRLFGSRVDELAKGGDVDLLLEMTQAPPNAARLAALGERVASAADNLDRAERLGLVRGADEWFQMRALRNQMVHEYVEDPVVLHCALTAGRDFVPSLEFAVDALLGEAARRGWQ